MAEGLSCALQWVHWDWLELAMSGMGQPRPLLAECTLQTPPLSPTPDTEKAGKNRQVLLGIILSLNYVRGSKAQGNKVREIISKFYFIYEK